MLCFCRLMGPNFYFYRLFCIFPYTWTHTNDKCTYKVSLPWIGFAVSSVLYVTYNNVSAIEDYKWQTLADFFSSVNKLVTSVLYAVIILIVNLRPKPWAEQLEATAEMVNEGICESGKVFLRKIQMLLIAVVVLLPLMLTCGCLIFKENDFVTNGDLWMVYLHFIPFAYVTSFCSFIFIVINMFLCYSTVLKHVLQYQTQHPIKELDISRKKHAMLLGYLEISICNEEQHIQAIPKSQMALAPAKLMDFMRWKQEGICKMFRKSNGILYIPFEAFFATEIFLIFIQYLFVINMVFTKQYLNQITLLFYAILYIASKQLIILLIMNASYLVITTSDSIKHILLEYSIRHSDPMLDLLTRIFLNKLQFMPTAVHTLGLNKVGNDDILPIFEFLLTQALVEIQFFQMF